MRSHHEQTVTVECLKCGHIGVLTREVLARFRSSLRRPLRLSSNACVAASAVVKAW
jgi:hypothetical protein